MLLIGGTPYEGHCDECSGMLLNAAAASSTISEQKLNKMHNAFEIGGDEVDLDCPFCDSQMRFRNIVFSRLDGTEMEPIESADDLNVYRPIGMFITEEIKNHEPADED